MNDNKQEIPSNATIRGQLPPPKLEDFDFGKIAKENDLRSSQLLKFKFIKQEASRGMDWPNNTSRN